MIRQNKKYDVVILTHGPKDDLFESIKMLINQNIKPTTIIIYNTDKSIFYRNMRYEEGLKKLIKANDIIVKHIQEKDFDHGKTRNDASRLCKSQYILFMTDDAIPYDKKLTTNLINGFEKENVAVVFARQLAKENAKPKEKLVREFNYPRKDIVKDKSTEKKYGIKNCFCSNSCAMYDRKVFEKLKRFDTKIIQNEDMLFAARAIENGYKVVYKSDAIVYHSHNLSYIEQFKRNYDIGKFQKEHKEIFERYKSVGEGMKMVKYVNGSLLRNMKIIDAIDFDIECAFRYLGFIMGKRG